MKEREDKQAQIPLFDEIPEGLKQREEAIRQTFDGTLGTHGITMVLNPLTGAIIRARLLDLKTGRITSYEPLSRGKWTNLTGDLAEGSPAYKKLDRVYEDVRDKLMLWRIANPRYGPIREWTTIKGKRYENSFDSKIILPEEWFEKVSVNLVNNSDKILEEEREDFEEEKPRKRTTYRRLPRQRTGHVKRSNIRNSDIVFSKEEPKIGDTRSTPAILRRNSDRDTKRVILDKGPLGKRVRRAISNR